ncbi:MAG: GC-type dockerin domain-anchored protein [Phycisphaerales bacterium]
MNTRVQRIVFAAANACATCVLAQSIAIDNPSFELPDLSPAGFTSTAPDGWTSVGLGTVGVFYPTVPTWGYTASHGDQLAYCNGGAIEQTLTENVRPGVEYVLLVDIIHRPGFFNTYRVELLAGDTVVAIDDGRLRPASGEFAVLVLGFEALAGDAVVGQPLRIRLSGPTQANFDNVRLTTCRVDLDGDDALTVFDFLAFQNFFAAGDLRADFTGDGALDFFDFLAFQNAFDLGCG